MLSLFESLAVLSIHEAKGTLIKESADRLKTGLAGAIMVELALMGKIQASSTHRVQLKDETPTNHPILDDLLNALKESEKERKFEYWINQLSGKFEKIRQQIVEDLAQKGVIRLEDKQIEWVTPSPLQADSQSSAKYALIQRMRAIILAHEEPQPHEIILLNMIRVCGLLNMVFLRDERKLADHYIYEFAVNLAMKHPEMQAIQEIETAVASLVEED